MRYTAGPKHGFKADVTYEGDDPRNKELTKPHKSEFNRSPSPFQHHSPVPVAQHRPLHPKTKSNRPTLSFKKADTPIYFSNPLKAQQPTKYYNHNDEDSFPSQNFQLLEPIRAAVTTQPPPSPPAIFFSSTPPSVAIYNHISSTPKPYSGPKSIYDKMPQDKGGYRKPFPTIDPDKSPRAGPSKKPKKYVFHPSSGFHEARKPFYDVYSSHAPSAEDDNSPPVFKNNGYQFNKPQKGVTTKLISPVPSFLDPHTLVSSQYSNPHLRSDHISNAHPTKSRLIPEGYFNQGLQQSSSLSYPGNKYETIRKRKRKKHNKSKQYHAEVTPHYHDIDVTTKKSIFQFLNPQSSRGYKSKEQDNRFFKFPETKFFDHGDRPAVSNYPPQSSLATFAAGLHPSIGNDDQSVHSQYFYTKAAQQTGRKKPTRPPTSGLVFLETPGTGERPTALGVGNAMERLPHSMTHTITHPYEVGSVDYGKNVGYSTSKKENNELTGGDEDPNSRFYRDSSYFNRRRGTNSFTPPGYHGSSSNRRRDYLIDNSRDTVVQESTMKSVVSSENASQEQSKSNISNTNNEAKNGDST